MPSIFLDFIRYEGQRIRLSHLFFALLHNKREDVRCNGIFVYKYVAVVQYKNGKRPEDRKIGHQ